MPRKAANAAQHHFFSSSPTIQEGRPLRIFQIQKLQSSPMASIGTPLAGRHPFIHFDRTSRTRTNMNSSLAISNPTKKRSATRRISASVALSNSQPTCSPSLAEDCRVSNSSSETIFPGNIGEWMEESVNDIVKNLKQAPLLVQVYAGLDGQGNSKAEFKTEKAVMEDWPLLKAEWKSEETKSPDGLMFVDELLAEEEENDLNGKTVAAKKEEEEGITKAWGIVVQRKGVECGPACYLLKTSRVGAGFGLGLFCTHFCLTRVTNFGESALGQLKHSWLLQ